MTAAQEIRLVVLRHPETEGNFSFRLAELFDDEASQWEEQLAHGDLPDEIDSRLGEPLTLSQVMAKLQARDFRVVDYPR